MFAPAIDLSHLTPEARALVDWNQPKQRTQKGVAYDNFIASIKSAIERDDPRIKAINEELLRLKDLKPSDVQHNALLSTISVQYANDEYVGDRMMPYVNTGKRSGTFYKYTKRDKFAAPDDDMSTRTEASEVSEGRTKATYSLVGKALKEFVDQTTLNAEDAPLNELMDAQANVLDLLALRTEKRIATVMTTSANYGSNTTAIAAANRWDVGGDPIPVINTALTALWVGRGPGRRVAFTSLDIWNVLKVHPRLLQMIRGNTDGMLTREMFARWFEIDELLVGKAREDTANEGQTESYGRIWSNVFGIVRVANMPSLRNAAFGVTFREKPTVQRNWFDPKAGEEGGWYTQGSHALSHDIVAADTGYLITTPIL